MTKNHQKEKIDTPAGDAFAVPERVSVAMAEIAGSMHEGLLARAVGTGLHVLMEADVTALAGPKGKHDSQQAAVRHGHERGPVTPGGRRVPVSRPRMRAADGSGELPVPTYELFAGTETLGSMAMERMLAELAADLSGLDLVALMVDEAHFGESCCVVALGIDAEGIKHPLTLVEGATENAIVVTDLLTGLREWGLVVTRPIRVGIDGAKALRKVVIGVFDHPVIQRCQLHKSATS